ncbi:MAG: acyl-ACP--UDP-N-acetylglucosamine O-acyltransferase [Verrucomicrobia bacterium]|nr:acyl-ACP--UDP-N-acetylglucosamine O-acyltransferase [Verrucomicrobiota bacterium]
MIHPTAVIHPNAQVDSTAAVGPCAVIDEHVIIGPGCKIAAHAYVTGHTTLAENNVVHSGAVIGDAPQDLRYKDEPTRLRIGNNNTFREHVTIHRSNKLSEDTVIGSGNYFMASSHVGHNCILGDDNILANGAVLGGHVTIADRVFISATCMIHQFVRIGTLALMQGGSGISKDLPPFTIAKGNNGICGLNVIGMRRAGLNAEQRLELKKLYHVLFRSEKLFRQALEEAQQTFTSDAARVMLDFVSASKRGVCLDAGRGSDSESE